MDQARRDSQMLNAKCKMLNGRSGKIPIVAHRRSFRPWLVTMEAETFFQFLRGTLPRQSTGAMRQESTKREQQ